MVTHPQAVICCSFRLKQDQVLLGFDGRTFLSLLIEDHKLAVPIREGFCLRLGRLKRFFGATPHEGFCSVSFEDVKVSYHGPSSRIGGAAHHGDKGESCCFDEVLYHRC